MAANKDIEIPKRHLARSYGYPLAAGAQLFKNAIVAVTAGLEAVPAGHANEVALIGLNELSVDNSTGAAGDQNCKLLRGVFKMPVAGATAANIGATVYALDDETLQLTNAGGELPFGTIEAIDAEGVWIAV